MSLSTIFQLYRGGQFYWWRKPEDPEKTTVLLSIRSAEVDCLIFNFSLSVAEHSQQSV